MDDRVLYGSMVVKHKNRGHVEDRSNWRILFKFSLCKGAVIVSDCTAFTRARSVSQTVQLI